MIHPRLSVNALCSLNWSFDQDLALWRALGVKRAGLLAAKIHDDPAGKLRRMHDAGIWPSVFVCAPPALDAPATWDKGRAAVNQLIDLAAETADAVVYFPPGRRALADWDEMVERLAEATAPCAAHARERGVRLGFEPSVRAEFSFVNTLRDAVHVAERTGLSLVVDFGNCWMERDLKAVLREAAAHACLVQICDVRVGDPDTLRSGGRVPPGEGDLPLRALVDECLANGYGGVFDLEVLGPQIEAEGYEAALRRGVRAASTLLAEATPAPPGTRRPG
jgi:sugar phosphate isomerase/epimerase